MSRKPRVYSDSGLYHVILRGNNKQNLFHDNQDRNFFLNRLQKYSSELNIDVYSYCLMNNHVHILIGNAGKLVSLFVQKLANSYVFFFNRKYDRTGHLFQGRFKSEPILNDVYFKTVYRYILKNCEKAGLGKYTQYKWNSFSSINNPDFTNSSFVISLYSSKNELINFLDQNSSVKCMEFDNKIVFSDERAFNFIKRLFGINSPHKLEQLYIDEQIEKCHILKENGLSMQQISRLTGISKSIIKSA